MTTEKYTPHVHAEVIKAWADGKPVEWRQSSDYEWSDTPSPCWGPELQYRIKPEKFVDYAIVLVDGRPGAVFTSTIAELKHYYSANNYQGYLKRTRLDGKVVSFEFISK